MAHTKMAPVKIVTLNMTALRNTKPKVLLLVSFIAMINILIQFILKLYDKDKK
jgi:hypothetical protein